MRKFVIGLVLMLAVFTFVGAMDDSGGAGASSLARAPSASIR